MRTAALKKFEMVDPARYGAPDPGAPTGTPKTASRMHAPLSTFAPDEGRNTARVRQRAIAYCGAAVLEISLLAAVWVLLARPPAQKPDDDSTAIEMVQPPQEPPPQLPVPQKIVLPTLKPMAVHPIPHLRLAVDRELPIPAPQMALQSPSPPPSAPPQASTEAVDRFAGEVRAAIQAAIIYPPAARMMKQQGRTKVAFKLIQGHAQDPVVIQSSGVPSIDTAAVAAVRDATYPALPPELAGKPLAFAVFVEFNLSKS
jgi:protein TonB